MFRRRKKINLWNEFTVLGVFAAVVTGGLAYAAVAILLASPELVAGSALAAPTAPTEAEYQGEAREVMEPFLSQAVAMDEGDIAAADPIFTDLVVKTQDRLLRLRVPKDSRDSHLSFVLLLDQWKRALGGSRPDSAVVLGKTGQVVEANPWLGSWDAQDEADHLDE